MAAAAIEVEEIALEFSAPARLMAKHSLATSNASLCLMDITDE